MEKCPHVETLTVSKDLSLLDPSKWLCSVCGTTEWVWACLSCAHVACGRLNEKHAVSHYEATKHHIAIEINEKYVYCYTCDEYIMEDNSYGDLEAIRSALTAIGTMSFEGVGRKGGNLLRSFSHQQEISYSHTDEDDRRITAQIHYRKSVLDKVFTAWADYAQKAKKEKKPKKLKTAAPDDLAPSEPPPMVTRSRSGLFHFKKRTLIPGVTGLRNLGNTCYINSIIQSLGHLEDFREYFCQLVFDLFSPPTTPLATSSSFSPAKGPLSTARQLLRLNTVDYYQHLNTIPIKSSGALKGKKGGGGGGKGKRCSAGGLNGGRADPDESGDVDSLTTNETQVMKAKADALNALSLCQELHGLLRVLWSGKWAQVSPHGFLHSVWRAIPAFKGHAQHDAQEFLCELLDKLSKEIEDLPQCRGSENIVDHSFRGELVSQVTCLSCKNTSRRYEPFLDLSLEFPPLFQQTNSHSMRKMCHLSEMLYKFTEQEELEPKTYSCEKCNTKRRRSSRQMCVKTDASKQLLISKPPEILRLHLKRFRWCGRNHREKINTHVAFDTVVDISPFCLDTGLYIPQYRLQAVVVHHGAGFRAGHYTAYTYNNDAASWVHCNDSRINLVSEEEVLLSQAYILFYTRELTPVGLDDMPTLSPESTLSLTKQSTKSTMPVLDVGSMQTLRRLSRGETEQIIDDDISISFHRDPTLIQRLTSIHSESDLKRTATLDFSTTTGSSGKPVKRLSLGKTRSGTHHLNSSHSDSDLKKPVSSSLHSETSFSDSNEAANASARLTIENNQRLSSLSPDSGMKRATSSPPCVSKFMQLYSEAEKGKGKSQSSLGLGIKSEKTLVPSEPSVSRKFLQSLRTTDAMKSLQRQKHNFTDLKREATLKLNPQSSSLLEHHQHSKMPSVEVDSQSSSQSEVFKSLTLEKDDKCLQKLSPIHMNLKKDTTSKLSPEKLSRSSKMVQSVTPEKHNTSPKQELSTYLKSEEPSMGASLNEESPVSESINKGSPEIVNRITKGQCSTDSDRIGLTSPASSPSKLVNLGTPEKMSRSPKRHTSIRLDASREPSLHIGFQISSLAEVNSMTSVTPEKLNKSPKRQSPTHLNATSSSPPKMVATRSSEQTISSPIKQSSTHVNAKTSSSSKLININAERSSRTQQSFTRLNAANPSPSKLVNERTPEKRALNSRISSPGKLIEKRTPEKLKSSPLRQCTFPSVVLNDYSSSPNKIIKCPSPNNVNGSPKQQDSVQESVRKDVPFNLITAESPSSPRKSVQRATIEIAKSSSPQRKTSIRLSSPSKTLKSASPEKTNSSSSSPKTKSKSSPVQSGLKREASSEPNYLPSSPTPKKLIKIETLDTAYGSSSTSTQ